MYFGGEILLLSFVTVLAHPIAQEDEPLTVDELNHFVDGMLVEVRNSPAMSMLDPLYLPNRQKAVEHGSYRLFGASVTGLSTLARLGDASYVRTADENRPTTVSVVLATQAVRVVAQLMAETNSDDISHGKIKGTVEPVQVLLQFEIRKGRQPVLISYTVNSHLHPVAEWYSGKTPSDTILSIVRDAIDYGFNFEYGSAIEKVVDGAMRRELTHILAKTPLGN